MTKDEAFKIISNVLAQLKISLQEHQALQTALSILADKPKEK